MSRDAIRPETAPTPSRRGGPSLAGRGREAMVPDEGLPFDVSRRRGRPVPDLLPDDPADLRRLPAATVLDAVAWSSGAGGRSGASPAVPDAESARADRGLPDLGEPAHRFFAAFHWTGAPTDSPAPR